MQEDLSVERTVARTLLTLCGLVGALFVLALFFHEQVVAGSRAFVQTMGPMGVGVCFFLPDATALPIPHDAVLAAAHLGGMPWASIVLWASGGSILGGLTAYLVARALAGTPWFAARRGPRIERAETLFHRYGATALAVSAISPLPYSLLSWASGGLGLDLTRFLVISLLRIPRVVGALWAIERGFVVGG